MLSSLSKKHENIIELIDTYDKCDQYFIIYPGLIAICIGSQETCIFPLAMITN